MLDRFTAGLRDGGHTVEVVDLYAIDFDPVFRQRDMATYLHEDIPPEVLESMNLRERFVENVPGGPVAGRSPHAGHGTRRPSSRQVHPRARTQGAREQWKKIAAADGLVFIAPVFWLHFPAILKGWFERVFAYGNAYALSPEGWQGHASGRIPLMHHDKALVMTPTLFSEADYKADWEEPMRRIIDDWGLRYPGVKHVEHVYFYGAAMPPTAIEGTCAAVRPRPRLRRAGAAVRGAASPAGGSEGKHR